MLQSGCNGYVSDRFGWRFIAPIRVVRFLVDLLKCEATYQFPNSGNFHALKKTMGNASPARLRVLMPVFPAPISARGSAYRRPLCARFCSRPNAPAAEPRADISLGKTGIKTLSRAGLALPHDLLERVQIPADEELVSRLTFEQID